MTSLGAYMNLQTLSPGELSVKPIWIDNAHKSKSKFKNWWVKHLPVVEAFNQYRIWNEWNNLLWYTGEILEFMEGARRYTDFTGFKPNQKRTIPFWINHISDLMDKRSNDLATLKANFEVSPPSDNITERTRTSSRIIRPILSHIKTFNNLDLLFDENERSNVLYGWSTLTIDWNDKIGDLRSKEKRKKDEDKRWEGEVEVKQTFPWYILPFPSRTFFGSPICIQVYEILHVDIARQKYQDDSIQPDMRTNLFSFASPFEADILNDEVVIYRTICCPNEGLPEGCVIYNTHDGKILKSVLNKYPWSHGGFPWETHTDMVAHGRVFPYSIMNELKPMQWTYNLIGGMIKKAIFLTSHPKWMVTRGSVNLQSLGNGITICQHKPGQKPELARYDVVGSDSTNFREDVKLNMQKRAGSFGLSNGDIPPNTRSGIQISRLQNIEKMNRSYQAGKRNDFMRRVLLKSASVAGDYYPTTSPEHLERILGKEMVDEVGVLADAKISAQYVITIQNSAGFSDDLAGRVEEVAFMRQQLPGLMTPQQEADILGVRSSQKFYDVATAALRMAEGENERFSDGKQVLPPIKEQDHIVHWQTHVIYMQTPHFLLLPLKIKQRFMEHLGMHEMFMEEIANSPTGIGFKQRLLTLERWPLVYVPNMDLPAIEAEAQAQKETDAQMVALENQKATTAIEQGQEPIQ